MPRPQRTNIHHSHNIATIKGAKVKMPILPGEKPQNIRWIYEQRKVTDLSLRTKNVESAINQLPHNKQHLFKEYLREAKMHFKNPKLSNANYKKILEDLELGIAQILKQAKVWK